MPIRYLRLSRVKISFMSPSPSMPQPPDDMPSKPTHSHKISATYIPSNLASFRPAQAPSKPNLHYTCFIRLPFRRNGFIDPPPVEWDVVKDKALWKLISAASNTKDLDWEEIASRFDVGLPFLLQQAAWLYERHFEGMRKQMQKLGTPQAPTPVPTEIGTPTGTPTDPIGGELMQRQSSKDSARMPLAVNTFRGVVSSVEGVSQSPGTPRSTQNPISRTPSTTTVTQSRVLGGGSPKQPTIRKFRGSSGSQKRPTVFIRPASAVQDDDDYALGHEASSDSAIERERLSRNLANTRRVPGEKKPLFRVLTTVADIDGVDHGGADGDDNDDDDDEGSSGGGYLPFATAPEHDQGGQGAMLRDISGPHGGQSYQPAIVIANTTTTKGKKKLDPALSDSLASSASSVVQHQSPRSMSSSGTFQQRARGPLSPKRRVQLMNANLSPRSRKGSEGSPSMGSSFSDLDDASITQSALEDALVSNMQAGNLSSIGSRMGSLREVLGKK